MIMALLRQSVHQAWAQWALEAFLQRLLISTSADMLTRHHTGFQKIDIEPHSLKRIPSAEPGLLCPPGDHFSLPVFLDFTLPQQFCIECNIYLNIPVPSHSRLYHHVVEHLHSNDFRLLLLSYTEGESEQPTVQTDLF